MSTRPRKGVPFDTGPRPSRRGSRLVPFGSIRARPPPPSFRSDSIVDDKQRQGANMNKAGFATVNPSTGEKIEAFSYFTPAQTEKVVARAHKSFQSFRELPVHKRAQLRTSGTPSEKTRHNSRRSSQQRWERSSPRL